MKTFIIAEAGVNHNGSVTIAKKLIDAAIKTGADAIKFQSFIADKIVRRDAPKAEYQKRWTGQEESQYGMLKRLELSRDAHKTLIEYCKSKKIEFLSSPFDLDSIELLHKLGIRRFKIPSGEITNLPYLRRIGSLHAQVILSTGMAYIGEVEQALNALVSSGTEKDDIIILHCNTEYPTRMEDVNLRAMVTMRDVFKVKVGYSDHTTGIEIPIAAVALGASAIEKHFTLDKKMEGPDHKASLDPVEFQNMVRAIRNIEKALGSSAKKPSRSEIKNRKIVRKSIVALRNIRKGERFTEKNVGTKRPGNGTSPMEWDKVIGKKAKRDFQNDELIEI